jgi:uncharacterized membrane protein
MSTSYKTIIGLTFFFEIIVYSKENNLEQKKSWKAQKRRVNYLFLLNYHSFTHCPIHYLPLVILNPP